MSKSISKNFIFNFIKTLMGIIFPLLTFIYASRVLGLEVIGKINFTKSFVQYFIMIGALGIPNYGIREGAKLRDDKGKLSAFSQEILIINVISTLAAYVILLILYFSIEKLSSYTVLIAIFSSGIILNSLGMEWLYGAVEDYKYIAVRAVMFQIAALILMFLFVKSESDLYIYAVIFVFSSYGSYVCNFFHCKKYISLKKINKLRIKRHLKPIFILFAFTASVSIYIVLDSTLLGFICGDRAVGIYTAGIKINKIVQTLITSLGVVLMPRLSYYIETNQSEKFSVLVEKAYHFVMMLSFPVCFGIYTLSEPTVMILSGEEFSAAIITSKLLVPIICFIPFSYLTNNQILIPMNKENLILISTCVGAVVNFISNIILIPIFEENGAAVATVIAELAVAIICFKNASKFCEIKKIVLSCWRYPVAAMSIFLIGIIVNAFDFNYILNIVITVFLSVTAYFSLLIALRDSFFIEQSKVMIGKIIKRRR